MFFSYLRAQCHILRIKKTEVYYRKRPELATVIPVESSWRGCEVRRKGFLFLALITSKQFLCFTKKKKSIINYVMRNKWKKNSILFIFNFVYNILMVLNLHRIVEAVN